MVQVLVWQLLPEFALQQVYLLDQLHWHCFQIVAE
jgi:hypothetical protein